MKNAFKNTAAIAIAIFCCFALSAAGNGVFVSGEQHYGLSGTETENVSKIQAELSHHLFQVAAKSLVEASYPKFIKLSFSGPTAFSPAIERLRFGSFSQYVKRWQNLFFFTSVDIIYPFHYFW